jgi:hypothetical protein
VSIVVSAQRAGWVLGIPTAAIVLAACGSSSTKTVTETTTVAATTTPATTASATSSTANTTPAESEANLTTAQKNAVRAAQNYLEVSAFSKRGLIDQLSSSAGDGYSVADAIAAVNTLNVNWNEQAAKAAKQYLEISPFSCSDLVQQLSSSAGDKYTTAEAEYGAEQAGVCSPTTTAAATPSKVQSTPNSGFTDCGGGIEARAGTTSCDFAQNVFYEFYKASPQRQFPVYSPATGKEYQMQCLGKSTVTCSGGTNAEVRFPMSAVLAYTTADANAYANSHDVGVPVVP